MCKKHQVQVTFCFKDNFKKPKHNYEDKNFILCTFLLLKIKNKNNSGRSRSSKHTPETTISCAHQISANHPLKLWNSNSTNTAAAAAPPSAPTPFKQTRASFDRHFYRPLSGKVMNCCKAQLFMWFVQRGSTRSKKNKTHTHRGSVYKINRGTLAGCSWTNLWGLTAGEWQWCTFSHPACNAAHLSICELQTSVDTQICQFST